MCRKKRSRIFPDCSGESLVASLYVGLMLLVFPLLVHDGYFDITETKCLCFLLLSAVFVMGIWALRLCRSLQGCAGLRKNVVFPQGNRFLPETLGISGRPFRRADGFALGFLVLLALSCLLSGHFRETILGQTNRYQGLINGFLSVAVFLLLARSPVSPVVTAGTLMIGASLVSLIAAFQHFGLDPMGFAGRLSDFDYRRYLSTIGNLNFYSSYLVLVFPTLLAVYSMSRKRGWRIGSYLSLLCFTCGMLPTSSESFSLGYLAAVLLLPFFLFDYPQGMARYLWGLLSTTVLLQLLRLLSRFVETRYYVSYSMGLLTKPLPALFLLLFFSGLLLMLRKHGDVSLSRWEKRYAQVLLSAGIVLLLGLVLANTLFSGVSFGRADRFLKLNENWGTDRGRIWSACLAAYGKFSPMQKLIGGGPGCVQRIGEHTALFSDAVMDSAHNEYLQYLLTNGLAGLLLYLGWLGSACAFAWKRVRGNPLGVGLLLGVIAYGIQAAVNIAQPCSTPLLFLFLGLIGNPALHFGDKKKDVSENTSH